MAIGKEAALQPDRSRKAHAGSVTIQAAGSKNLVTLAGDAVISTIEDLGRQLSLATGTSELVLDLAGLTTLDTAGAWMILDLESKQHARNGQFRITGASQIHLELLDAVRESIPVAIPAAPVHHDLLRQLEMLGKRTLEEAQNAVHTIGFLGAIIARIGGVIRRPRRLRFTSLIHHMQEIGLNAIPIVSLMAFLIGVVLAFQGASQLRQFGAEVFVVDLIAISVLRELGILLTAIIVAGRSGAAFTAAIGSMKMREEIDAMRTLGLDPLEVLVVPRVLALILVLPVLGFIADMMGLLGGALMSWIELGVSPGMFKTRLYESVGVWHYAVGLIKAPFFALIIGLVGSYEGMQVQGNAESLGRLTSKSVVVSIFMVIVADAMFSIFFAIVDV